MKSVGIKKFDGSFFACLIILVLIGFLTVLTSTFIRASEIYNDPYFFLKKHAIFAFVGFALMMSLSRYDYNKLQKWVFPLFLITILLLIATLIPGLGISVKGARRWLNFIFFRFQTSEFAKYVLIFFLANYYKKRQDLNESFFKFVLKPILFLSPIFILIILQPNYSTLSLLGITAIAIMFVAGIKWKHIVYISSFGLLAAIALIFHKAYRLDRITIFLDPWSDPEGKGYQTIQALIAFSSGGFFGSGLGASKQALFLPEAHNDFVFAIIAEQAGFLGVMIILGIFFAFIYRGIRIAVLAPDLFGRILVFGIMFIVCVQLLFNVGVVLGLLPVTGLPLPFLSYGGTALISFMAFTGIVLNVSRSIIK
jgi:cell division protein FtsW